MYFNVSYRVGDFFSCNIAVAESAEDVRASYANQDCELVTISEASEAEVTIAKRKGMPIVECAHVDEMPTAENSDLDVYVRNEDNGAAYTVRFPASWDSIVSTLQRVGVSDEDEEISAEYCEVVDFADGFEMFGELRAYSLCEIAEAYDLVSSLDKWDAKTLRASCEWDSPSCAEDLMDRAEDVKRGDILLYEDINNEYDLGYYWIEESGCYDLSSVGNLANYFDYEAFGRDISLDAAGGFTSYGFVERC